MRRKKRNLTIEVAPHFRPVSSQFKKDHGFIQAAHLSIRYWASKEGESRFDVSKAGLVLGSKTMIELEGQMSKAAEDVRACQPVFRSMSANKPSV
ncbi:MAG TPA: hypothetical protein ENJ91_05285 [Rhodobacteraceae bacterium]|nr:hypothetical protein [Paracoccaceae bacterium]